MPSKVIKNSKAILIANGSEFHVDQLFKYYDLSLDVLICCDGAANRLMNSSLIPDIIIGDLDSIDLKTKTFFAGKSKMIHQASQYQCDLEKALDYCVAQQLNQVVLFGLSGGRADYAIANFIVLKQYCTHLELEIIGSDYQAYPVVSQWSKQCEPGQLVSFIPFGECTGIDFQGLKYPLHNAKMPLGDIAVSNVVVNHQVFVKISSGYACVFVFNKA